jgi:glucose/arabinose dehydrogenase
MATFNPLARPGTPEYGLLYLGIGDGGSGGDPQNVSQMLDNGFGKIFRIDPLGKNSKNGKYGIPPSNPFAARQDALGEIYAYGVRNPQRFGWDAKTDVMYLAEIGQNIVEEISPVPAGGNLGWNVWEGSFKYGARGVESAPRDPSMVYPVVEYQHGDPPLINRAAATGVYVFRGDAAPAALKDKMLFGDNPSGELFWVDISGAAPNGGSEAIHRILLRPAGGQPTPLIKLIQARNTEQGKTPATRADLRLGVGADVRVFILNKADGTIRVITSGSRE